MKVFQQSFDKISFCEHSASKSFIGIFFEHFLKFLITFIISWNRSLIQNYSGSDIFGISQDFSEIFYLLLSTSCEQTREMQKRIS